MTQISLVVSDVDGTLLTKDKILTYAARSAVRQLRDAGIGFTITSSRPAFSRATASNSTFGSAANSTASARAIKVPPAPIQFFRRRMPPSPKA